MKSFPTVQDLAAASEESVNSHWAGLGFYRRARLLHKGAKHVVDNNRNDGEIPQSVEELLKIDGIGPCKFLQVLRRFRINRIGRLLTYIFRFVVDTANAIASIAFDVSVPVVDGNVCRVLSRLTGIANHIKAPVLKDRLGWDLAKQLIQAGDGDDDGDDGGGGKHCAGEVNQALMELGATYCAPSGTGMDERDPLLEFYVSTKLGREYAMEFQSGNVNDNFGSSSSSSGKKTKKTCELCDSNGVDTVLAKLREALEGMHNDDDICIELDEAAKCGHAIIPLNPPKTKKREEDVAVAALRSTFEQDTWWLLVKRPTKGLLAGQWEFPSVCVQTRDKNSKAPRKQSRQNALTAFLEELSVDGVDLDTDFPRVQVDSSPIEHIFSHIVHYYWVESSSTGIDIFDTLEWTASNGRQARWMREIDMAEVGITSGVKKVLKAVKEQSKPTSTSSKRRKR
jgi:A/G-specific adenine glycosylase